MQKNEIFLLKNLENHQKCGHICRKFAKKSLSEEHKSHFALIFAQKFFEKCKIIWKKQNVYRIFVLDFKKLLTL